MNLKECNPTGHNGYGILWIFLAVLGIDVMERKSKGKIQTKTTLSVKYAKKLLSSIFPLILHLMQIYAIGSWYILIEQKLAKLEVMVSFVVVNLFSTALWHDVYRKKALIRDLVNKCQKIEICFHKNVKNMNFIINICLALTVIISTISALLCSFYMSTYSIEYKIYYSFFWLLRNENFICLLIRSVITVITSIILLQLPAVVAILSSAIYYKFSNLLGSLAEDVEELRYPVPEDKELLNVMKRYNLLYQLALEVEKALSSSSFLLLCSQGLNLSVVLVVFIVLDSNSFSSVHTWECIPRLILDPLIIVAIVLCGSRISSQIQRIRTNLQLIHNALNYEIENNWKTLEHVKNIMRADFPQMTALGVLTIKPVLILSTFGSVLTYGLLVLSIKKNN
ncbi:uncharacterized protein NPIL_662631 [Nephila pilipes]|uniref:Gustatory receptor n=1 Tax=Nephila pilipes TaxID=299642 RepID=A0A8X6QJX7_NEPPI|nr:uncharacterized protein NPIL_662631 [Nephila pilipes]